jgi:23S rRNA (cytosine1962-C5)-methyltransferase
MMDSETILITEAGEGYELIDSGDGEKLERFGNVLLARPDPQALWKKTLPKEEWQRAHGRFRNISRGSKWAIEKDVPERWSVFHGGSNFWIKPTSFKHTGLFPEQAANWQWIRETISKSPKQAKVLNLFGYTGGATVAALQAGAQVVHVDASKTALTWARENVDLNNLAEKPVRWILDDAREFLRKEARRGNTHDAIIMDPPAFGHGPKGELWKIEAHFQDLVDACSRVLSTNPLFILINGYSSGYSAIAYGNNISSIVDVVSGSLEIGELTLRESAGKRLLPAGIFARYRL